METKEYRVVCKFNLNDLILSVNFYLKDGWELNGGIAVIEKDSPPRLPTGTYYQAMSRTIKSE